VYKAPFNTYGFGIVNAYLSTLTQHASIYAQFSKSLRKRLLLKMTLKAKTCIGQRPFQFCVLV